VRLEAGSDEVLVRLEDDLSVFGAGAYTVVQSLDTAELAPALASSVTVPLGDIVDDDGDPGLYLMDGIYERISTDLGATQADLFLGARLSSGLDEDVNAVVTTDLVSDLEALSVALVAELSDLELVGTLDGDFWGELDQACVLNVATLQVPGASLAVSEMLAADPAADELRVTYLQDVVTLHEHVLPVGAGEVVVGVLSMVVLPSMAGPGLDTGVVAMEEYLSARVDCAAVAAAIAADTDAGSIAEATWYQAACEDVLASLASEAVGGASALDSVLPSITIEGNCDFLGADFYPRSGFACEGTLPVVVWGEEVVSGGHTMRLEEVPVD
jgi:hypothetical protein